MKTTEAVYAFPLGIQLVLPDKYRADRAFADLLTSLQELGFTGVELNIREPEKTDPDALGVFLGTYGLRMTMFATGLTARARGLSLSSEDEALRCRSVEECRGFIDFAARMKAGVIIGFLKGKPGRNKEAATGRMARSLQELGGRARKRDVPILIEATNHKESAVVNRLEEAAGMIDALGNGCFRILPDTYHMIIEEDGLDVALNRYKGRYPVIHLSGENRFLPGLGFLDFKKVIGFLKDIGYQGTVSLEGNILDDLRSDIKRSMEYLAPILSWA